MKRKLLAAIMLIVLAFGVMAFAACDDSGTFYVESSGADKDMPPIRIAAKGNKTYTLDEPYIVELKYGHIAVNSSETDQTSARLFIHNAAAEGDFDPDVDPYCFEVQRIFSEEYYIKHDVDSNGWFKNLKYPKTVEIEIPKDCITGTSGRVQIALVVVYLDEKGNCIGYEGPAVLLQYEISNGKIHFSK